MRLVQEFLLRLIYQRAQHFQELSFPVFSGRESSHRETGRSFSHLLTLTPYVHFGCEHPIPPSAHIKKTLKKGEARIGS